MARKVYIQDIELTDGGNGVSWNDVKDKPEFSNVATSGDYNDLINKPEFATRQDVIDIINEVIAARS